MKYIILFSFFIFTAQAQGRKPALEEFVGVVPVEESELKAIPQEVETRSLEKFSNKISEVQNNNMNAKPLIVNSENNKSWSGILGFSLFLILPFLMWTAITNLSPKKKLKTKTLEAAKQNEDDVGITHLDDYRNNPDDTKRAS